MSAPPAQPRRTLAEPLLVGAALLVFVVLTRYHWQQRCDDAFIVFRVADHWVAGLGPVWNRGERVEAYSSPLWLGSIVLLRWLGLPLPQAAGMLGVGCAGLALVLLHRLALLASASRLVAAASCAVATLVYPLYFWAPAGLETALLTALSVAAAAGLLRPSPWRWCIPAALLGIARPEGPLLALALVALATHAHGRVVLRWSWVAVGPALAWLIFRRCYYGVWLPNPYYAKATGALAARLVSGAAYSTGALAPAGATGVALWLAGDVQRKVRAVLLYLALGLVIVVGGGGDWMWHGRLLLPLVLPLVALAAAAIARLRGSRRVAAILGCLLAGSGFLPAPALVADAGAGHRLPATAYQEGSMTAAATAAAAFIHQHYQPDALIAVNHAGALPYALPNPALDMTGLADAHIARDVAGGLHRKFDARYVLARQPRLIVLNSRVRPGTAGLWYHPGYWAGESALVSQPEFARDYRPVETYWPWQWQGQGESYIVLYERK